MSKDDKITKLIMTLILAYCTFVLLLPLVRTYPLENTTEIILAIFLSTLLSIFSVRDVYEKPTTYQRFRTFLGYMVCCTIYESAYLLTGYLTENAYSSVIAAGIYLVALLIFFATQKSEEKYFRRDIA
jgi:hypothetical protein